MSKSLPATRWSAPARLAAAAACMAPLTAMAQTTFYFESFDSAVLNQQASDPAVIGSCANAAVWTKTPPAGWTQNDCGVPSFYCRVGLPQGTCPNTGSCVTGSGDRGVREWEGWSFPSRAWWAQVAGDQRRSEFTLGTGVVAVADPDEWDDSQSPVNTLGYYNTFMTSPSIPLNGVNLSSLSLSFASSWRDEGFDDGVNGGVATNNQTATIVAIYSTPGGEERRTVLLWDSNPASATFKDDNPNEAVTLSDLAAPAGATAVRFELSLTNAGNDWWWAVDNLVLRAGATQLWTETFEGVTLGPPVEEPGGACAAFCGVNVTTKTGPNGVVVTTPPSVTGGVPDWRGWTFAATNYWSCVGGQNRNQFTLGDGLVAIADVDEWNDTSPVSGELLTVMATPAINITGRSGSTVLLSFDSSWRGQGNQTGVVTATFSDGSTAEVLRLESNPSSPFFKADALDEVLVAPIFVPAGATTVSLRFSYAGDSNFWWAIDDLRVFEGTAIVTIDDETPRTGVMALAPSVNYSPCSAPVALDPPAGWTESEFSAPGLGVPEWRGWSFGNREWWSTNVDDQARSEFTRGTGFVAIADPDEWDDANAQGATFDSTMTSPTIALPANPSSFSFSFDSSWRPECCDDGDQTNNQSARITAIYSTPGGPVSVEVLNWQSNDALPNFKDNATNERVTLDAAALQRPANATAVRFEFRLFNARNDWWWAIDNLALNVNGATAFSENFEFPQNALSVPLPFEQAPTTLCFYYSTVAQQGSGFLVNAANVTGCTGVDDFRGFTAWLTDAWARGAGLGERQQFGARTAYISDFDASGCDGRTQLVSPIYNIAALNAGSVELSFRSGWKNAPGHLSSVEVSFNNGPFTPVLLWNADAAPGTPGAKATTPDEVVTLSINNPDTANTMRVRFNDDNSGWWALSDIRVRGTIGVTACSVADIVSIGGFPPADGELTVDDYTSFINAFAGDDLLADIVSIGGFPPPDDELTVDDYTSFINAFAEGCE